MTATFAIIALAIIALTIASFAVGRRKGHRKALDDLHMAVNADLRYAKNLKALEDYLNAYKEGTDHARN